MEHALRVLILALGFGKSLSLSEEELKELGEASLVYDIGNLSLPVELLTKKGRLNVQEKCQMKRHTELGYQRLQNTAGVCQEAMNAALMHHERIDGKGYPNALTGEKIPFITKIISIIDTYDALTSDRSYKAATSPQNALNIIYQGRGKQFDRELAEKFISFVGIYPPGHIVELNTGHVGIVISNEENARLHPKLLIVRCPEKEICSERVIDLKKYQNLKSGNKLSIKALHSHGAFGINLKHYRDLKIQNSMKKKCSKNHI